MFEIPRSERDATTSEHFIIWSSIRVQKYDTNTKRRGANFCQILSKLFFFVRLHYCSQCASFARNGSFD